MNTTCCNNPSLNWFKNKDLRWFNNKRPISISSDYITFQTYANTVCNNLDRCCKKNSSSYTASLKANLIYPAKFSSCNCKK